MSLIFSTAIGLTLLPWTLAYPATFTPVSTLSALPIVPLFPSPPTNATSRHLNEQIERRFTPGACGVHVDNIRRMKVLAAIPLTIASMFISTMEPKHTLAAKGQ
jgi:hypothetical protein